ncbi:hypothetical protein S7711_07903 [Stachybotrys chartarum IBT 7711]|uniref:Uncharacterized protein n=1 Tax=Stachybotrys chartarum (strain CBS 109288 / IBT 7711) TaxID=1280523 RepID=A0A084B5W0_STACB|nr:hypothetical protein S7711_07903 [Stachybotrys chartarum IBT 7711]KFA47966.1 hypothetical protein S40293_09074 [Stachybotrys chartarum IBT 40293]KFA70777.1 hypothetical protein S40288_09362 [Stachybotrys chartarum IBT 40288]
MPNIQAIRAANTELPHGPPLVVALAGGTTGIGSYVANALAKIFADNGSKLRVYIIGRNKARADTVIDKCKFISKGSEWRFVQASNLGLLSEVDRCSAEIIHQETADSFHGGPPRLDMLYMTYCYPILKEPTITEEGLDTFISTTYYSRIRFITQLAPLLTASPITGHAISVYAGGMEDGTKPGEFPVGTPPSEIYNLNTVRKHSAFMKTFAFEELAEQYAGRLSLVHIYPGLVDGPGFLSPEMPTWFRFVWRLLKPLLSLFAMTSSDDCGQVMVYLSTRHFPAKGSALTMDTSEIAKSTLDEPGGGAYGVGQRGDAVPGIRYEKVREWDTRRKVWQHTMDVIEGAVKTGQMNV